MFCSEESDCIFRLQNNIVYELQSIQFSTALKHKHDGKLNQNTSCVTKLQMNNERSFNNAVVEYFWKRILEITGISSFACLFFCKRARAFVYMVRTWTQTCKQFFNTWI